MSNAIGKIFIFFSCARACNIWFVANFRCLGIILKNKMCNKLLNPKRHFLKVRKKWTTIIPQFSGSHCIPIDVVKFETTQLVGNIFVSTLISNPGNLWLYSTLLKSMICNQVENHNLNLFILDGSRLQYSNKTCL